MEKADCSFLNREQGEGLLYVKRDQTINGFSNRGKDVTKSGNARTYASI